MIDPREHLPFWLDGAQATKLGGAARAFWARWEAWLLEALAQADIRACSDKALEYHAHDRAVDRLPGESLALLRNRVLHAVTVATSSGARVGLERILAVYGVIGAAVDERVEGLDWDIVQVRLDPNALNGAETGLLDRIFHEWGRLCRRYLIVHLVPTPAYHASTVTDELQHVETAA